MQFIIQRLDNRNRSTIFKLLLEDVHSNLFLIDILIRRGISNWGQEEWFGAFKDDILYGLVVAFGRSTFQKPARLIVPVGSPEACRILGEMQHKRGGTELIIGERIACDALYQSFREDPLHIFYDQRLYICNNVNPGDSLPICVATEKYFLQVLQASAQMMKEDDLIIKLFCGQ